ncbi:MAG: hypothetical protein ACREDY_28855 [Bradyrhizobium sp.]
MIKLALALAAGVVVGVIYHAYLQPYVAKAFSFFGASPPADPPAAPKA